MKSKIYLSFLATIILTGAISLRYFTAPYVMLPQKGIKHEEEGKKKDRPDLAWLQYQELTKDPALGYTPTDRLQQAYLYAEQLRKQNAGLKTSAAITGVQWYERGPNNVGGRTRAILVDPNDATKKTVFSAGVNGGLWKTTDITVTNPVWTPINDFFNNLAIICIAANPNNPLEMYFCTGEGHGNIDAARGQGVWKSTDGGITWNQLASSTGFQRCQRIIVTQANTVLVATNAGLRRSTDGGATWTTPLAGFIYDVEQAVNGDIYATPAAGISKSTNDGATWAALTLPIAADRVEIACAPSDANYVYALVENGNVVNGIIRSTNAGTTWTTRTEPVDADTGIPATDFSRSQAWYDLCIAVSPTNRDHVFVGGIDLFKSTDGCNTWQQISHWYGGFGFQEVHADQHWIYFEPGNPNVIYFGNDGGIYRTINGTAAIPTITQKNSGYNVTQFYACASGPIAGSNYFLAGAQDNGSQQFSFPGVNSTIEVTGGDGAFCHIDQDQPQYQWTSYVNNNYFRSTNCGQSFTSVTLSSNTGASFINPTDYDNVANIMYCSNAGGNYVRWDNPQSGNTHSVINIAAFGGGDVTHINATTNTANRVFFGLNNGRVVRVDNAHTGTPTATHINSTGGMPTTSVSCIAVEQGNDNHLLVTYSNYGVNSVWETTNGGATWTSVEGNVPDMPVWWALFNPNNPDQAMIATELGVWTTDDLNGGATVWGPSNAGLANTRVTMLQLRTSDKLVVASTHGRGLFTTDIFMDPAPDFSVNTRVAYVGQNLTFTNSSAKATSYLWNFGDATTSTLANPTKSYATPGLYTVTLTINGGCPTCTKSVTNYIQVLPDRPVPYLVGNGGDFETNVNDFGGQNMKDNGGPTPCGTPLSSVTWERGNSAIVGKNGFVSASNAWVTGLTAANYSNNDYTILYSPSFDFSGAGTYTLQFQTKFDTEAQYDGYIVEYSTDRGTTWTQLNNSVAAGWYNTTALAGGIFTPGTAFFSGLQSTYSLRSQNVSFLSGNSSVAFRFVFRADGGVTDVGAAIDDFEILYTSTLPNTALNLQGIHKNGQNELTWKVESPEKASFYTIEYSYDGVQFNTLPVQVSATQNKEYAYNHASSHSRTFYRIIQHNKDGQSRFSNVIEISIAENMSLVVYPVPSSSTVTVQGAFNTTGNIQYAVFNTSGQKVLTHNENINWAGIYTHTLNIQALPAGIYYLRIQEANQVTVKKIVKI
jgi:PKD repeat protein